MGILAACCVAIMALFAVVVITYLAALWARRDALPLSQHLRLSVLVAARDEEHGILACLQALHRLNYPAAQLQILIGDDDSSDGTARIVQDFIRDKPHFHYHHISQPLPGLRGKQNVLAQLSALADGDLLLITDADIEVHPDWAAGMAAGFADARTGIVCGPTLVWGNSLFARLQGLDWLMGQVLARAHAGVGIPISAVGNNMAVRREAYDNIGGYAALPFNIIEDFLLFHALVEQGPWRYKMVFHPGLSAESLPVEGLQGWFRQRKRWFRGARGLAWYNLLLIFLNALVMPAIVASALLLPWPWTVAFVGAKLLADFLLLLYGALRLGKLSRLMYFLPYEAYYVFSMIATPVLMMLPGRVVWKGRRY